MGQSKVDEKNTANEVLAIDYILVRDYYIPDLRTSQKNRMIGKYGFLRKEYIKERHHGRYTYLFLSGQFWQHLADVNEQA